MTMTTPLSQAAKAGAVANNPPPGAGWQPIETAPKDGSYMLLGGCKAGPNIRIGSWGFGRYNRSTRRCARDWLDCGLTYGFDPTHWMPLPAPPADGGVR